MNINQTTINPFAGLENSALIQKKTVQPAVSFKANDVFFSSAQKIDTPPDYLKEFRKNGAVVSGGGGTMGSGIATNLINTGIPVSIHEAKDKFVEGGLKRINGELDKAIEKGISAPETKSLLKGGYSNDNITDIPKDTGIVIEAIFENRDAKRELFEKLDQHLSPESIIATNTSSLSVDDLATATNRPDKFIGIHFFFPAHKNRFVEIIPGEKTSTETVERTKALVRAMGKTPIVCNDGPGFAVNRMLVPVMNEGIKMFDEEMAKFKAETPNATAEQTATMEKQLATTIEQAAKETLWPEYSKLGLGLGPFSGLNMPEYMGLIGEITQVLHGGLGDAYKPADTVLSKSAAFRQLNLRDEADQQKFEALKFQLGGPEDLLNDRLQGYKDRLLGLVLGTAGQLLDEGVTSPQDLNRGVQIGTQWELAPFEKINKMGADKALKLVEGYNKVNPDFYVSETLKTHAATGKTFDLNYIESRKEGSTQFITINKPQRNNAMDLDMMNNLSKAFKAAEKDDDVKTIVFESIGGKHFVSGADLPWLEGEVGNLSKSLNERLDKLPDKLQKPLVEYGTYRFVKEFLTTGISVYNDIANSKKVTVSKVNGTALGGGTELALASDYIIAGEDATFGLPEVKYGIFPAWGGTERLPQRVGSSLAKFMVMEGALMDNKGKAPGIINGAEAAEIGLADDVVPTADLDRVVEEKLASGDFTQKVDRPSGSHQNGATLATLSENSRFREKYKQYNTSTFDQIFETVLKPLYGDNEKVQAAYERAAKLAWDRTHAVFNKPITTTKPKNMKDMLKNMQSLQKAQK